MDRKPLLHGALCLSPLVPALLLPGMGALISLAIVILALVFVAPSRQPALAFRYSGIARSIAVGLVCGLAIAVLFDLAIEPLVESLAGSEIALEGFGEIEGNFSNYLAFLALGLLFGGIAEELIFRGFVVGWGSQIFGQRSAIWLALLSACVFGTTHFYQGIPGVVTTGMIGFLFGLIYIGTGKKLLPAIIAHMTVNAYGITQLYLGGW
jgi:membrane protease YdiL (CAAX protease family)